MITHDATKDLNDEQREAIQDGDGPPLIIAGADAAKTQTLLHRVVQLIQGSLDPRRILLWLLTLAMVGARLSAAEQPALVEVWQIKGILAALKDGYPEVRANAARKLAELLSSNSSGAQTRCKRRSKNVAGGGGSEGGQKT